MLGNEALSVELVLSRHAERDATLLTGNATSSPVIALSICGSLLPAAAAAVSHNVRELIEVSTFLAAVTCRPAVQIKRRGIQIEVGNGGIWACSCLGQIVPQLRSILEKFHQVQVSRGDGVQSAFLESACKSRQTKPRITGNSIT